MVFTEAYRLSRDAILSTAPADFLWPKRRCTVVVPFVSGPVVPIERLPSWRTFSTVSGTIRGTSGIRTGPDSVYVVYD